MEHEHIRRWPSAKLTGDESSGRGKTDFNPLKTAGEALQRLGQRLVELDKESGTKLDPTKNVLSNDGTMLYIFVEKGSPLKEEPQPDGDST